MSVVKGKGLRVGVAVLFTAGICVLVYPYLSWEVLKRTASSVDLSLALGGLAVYVGVTALRSLRFVVAGARLSFTAMFKIAAVHAALLRVMPLRSGELAYGILLKKHGGGGFGEGIAAILMLRILDLATVLPLAVAVTLAWVTGSQGSWTAGLAVAAAGVTLGVLFFSLGPLSRYAVSVLPREPKGGLWVVVARVVRMLAEAYEISPIRRLQLLGITVLLWAMVLLWFHLTLLSVGAVDALSHGLVVGVLGVTGSILPVSLIGSFGPMEGGLALGLSAIGHAHEAVAAESIVVSTLTFLCNWLVAMPMWIALAASFATAGDPSNKRDISRP